MPHLVCVECQRKLTPYKSGAFVVVMFNDPAEPYQIFSGDIWACPVCGVKVVAGMGHNAIAQHWQPGFADMLQRAAAAPDTVYQYER